MFAARKLDGEDPDIIFMLRCVYGAVQTVAVMVVLFIFAKANTASKDKANAVKVYVPPPPQVSSDFLSWVFICIDGPKKYRHSSLLFDFMTYEYDYTCRGYYVYLSKIFQTLTPPQNHPLSPPLAIC